MNAPELCQQLQDGDATPDDLKSFLATGAGGRGFFKAYFGGDEWTCADAAEPPAALTTAIAASTPATLDMMLMSIVTGAATSDAGPSCRRATLLVNVLWDELEDLRISTLALKDAVGEKLGSGEALTGWDANYEMAKDEWTGILGLVKYDGEQLQRVSDALKEVGTEEVSFEGKGAISVDDGSEVLSVGDKAKARKIKELEEQLALLKDGPGKYER